MVSVPQARDILKGLTEKQRDALRLVAEHKTSKEAALVLGISPYTVDQRINAIKQKLGLATRRELINLLASLGGAFDQTVYQEAYIPESPEHDHGESVDGRFRVTSLAACESLIMDSPGLSEWCRDPIAEAHSDRGSRPARLTNLLIGLAATAFFLANTYTGIQQSVDIFGFLLD